MNRLYKKNGGIAIFVALSLLPLALGLSYALAYSLGFGGLLSHGFTLEHWAQALGNQETGISLLLSMVISLLATGISVLLSLMAVLYWGDLLEKGVAARLLYLPLTVPPLVAAFITFQWLGKTGMLARLGLATGLIRGIDDAPEWVNDTWYTGVMVTLIMLTAPYFMLLFLQYKKAERLNELANLARSLGASEKQIVRRILVPVLWKRALPNIGLSAIFLFGAYEAPLLLGRQTPRMISVMIAQKFRRFDLNEIPEAYALTVLYALVVALASWLIFKYAQKTGRAAV